ncbi:MAG: ABC transporter permease subunit [Planctomycetota bacterium]|nr:ABC transporter permease subunit [Planctomycetota bacterium]
MIRQPIPTWLFLTLAASGLILAIFAYGGLSARLTEENPSQSVLPGVKGFLEGVEKVTKARGSESRPKPSWISRDIRTTYWRLFSGLVLGAFVSILVGIAMGAYTAVEAFLSPVITFMAKIPPTAMLAIYMVVFGTKYEMYVALIGFGIFFTMVQSIYQSVKKDVAEDHIDKAYTLGASEFEVILEVIWRQILPRVIDNIRLHIGPAMVFLIAAEMLFAAEGFGYTIRQQSRLANMNVVYIYLAILGVTGLLMDYALMQLRRWLCPWFGD